MIVTINNQAQISLPNEIVEKLALSEGDQLDVVEKNGAIVLVPLTAHTPKHIDDLKKQISGIKAKIVAGDKTVFADIDDLVGAVVETLEKR